MILIPIRDLLGNALQFGAGATLGQEHFASILERIKLAMVEGSGTAGVVFDYSAVADVSASYIKATLLAVHQCGRLAAGGLSATEAFGSRVSLEPLDIVVGVLQANDDVKACINDVFAANGIGIAAGSALAGESLANGEVLGVIEDKALRTLQLVASYDEVTAAKLHSAHTSEGITITGWNNRLADLHRQLLLRRQTSGRQHTYCPMVKGAIIYGKILHRK